MDIDWTLAVLPPVKFASILGMTPEQVQAQASISAQNAANLKQQAVERIKQALIHPLRIQPLPQIEMLEQLEGEQFVFPTDPYYSSPMKTNPPIPISSEVAMAYFEFFAIGGFSKTLPPGNPFAQEYNRVRQRLNDFFKIQYPEKYPNYPDRVAVLSRSQPSYYSTFEDNLLRELGFDPMYPDKKSLIANVYPALQGIHTRDFVYSGSLFLERLFFENILRSGFEKSRIHVLLWILSNHISGMGMDLFVGVMKNLEEGADLSTLEFSFLKGAPDHYERQIGTPRPKLEYLVQYEVEDEHVPAMMIQEEFGRVAEGQQPTSAEVRYLVAYFRLVVNDFKNLMAQYAAEFNAANL